MQAYHAMLVEIRDRVQALIQAGVEEGARLVAVYAGERYLGLVSREDLSEALSVLLFMRRRSDRRRARR